MGCLKMNDVVNEVFGVISSGTTRRKRAVISDVDAEVIRSLKRDGVPVKKIAEIFNMAGSSIYAILSGCNHPGAGDISKS